MRVTLIAASLVVIPVEARSQVSGVVRDGATSLPVEGALVTLRATSERDTTGIDGVFDLPGASGASLVIAGAARGYYNKGVTVASPADSVEILLAPAPIGANAGYPFAAPASCGGCHPDQLAQWTDSPMARAGTNTWVYDTYDGTGTAGGAGGFVYTRDSIHSTTEPESDCASCHQPEPWVATPFSGLEPIDSLSVGAMHGVACDLCHKVADIDEAKTNFPGIYPGVVTMNRPAGPPYVDQVQYGVLGDATYTAPGLMRASYQPQLTAAVCAACHQDKNDPDEDGDFEEENGVISEPTYLEWLASPYGDPGSPLYATCAGCHMPQYGATRVCAVLNPPLERDPATIRSHRIEGTTAAYLENAVDLTVAAEVVDDSLVVRVSVTNSLTGHHVPTGVTIRNMILLVDAWREEGSSPLTFTGDQTIHALGGVGDPAQGYYAGLPGKLYAKVSQDANGNGPVFFTDAASIQFDNRIPALATDETRFTFDVPVSGGTLHARARLIYRRSFRALVDAKQWTLDGHGNPLEDVSPPHFGHLMEEAADVVAVTAVASGGRENSEAEAVLKIHPNPARPATVIEFGLARASAVRVSLYTLGGRRVMSLVDEFRSAGWHRVPWGGFDDRGLAVASGVYLCRVESNGGTQTKRFVVIR
ncbi:MAG: T9SS type A sorting domain-containing protein [bacterium]